MTLICIPTAEFPMPAGPSGAPAPITCHQMLFERRLLFVGLATGQIVAFRRRVDSLGVEQIDSKPLILEGHSGLVRCLLLVRQEGLGQEGYLLFSGGADRTVRVWDPSASRDGAKPCVQTLRGHGGTVTSLAYCEGVLVTSSTDCSIKVWKQDEGRELLLYPWFSPQQSIGQLDCWVNDIALQMGETGALYVGDEQGGLCAYRIERSAPAATRAASLTLTPWRQKPKAHAFGIEKLLLVMSESLLISSGYDNTVRLWDSGSGVGVMTIENEHKCRFTALQWDSAHMELLLGDDMGFVYFYNVATEKCIKKERLNDDADRASQSIRSISTVAGELLVSSPGTCSAWLVVRDVKYSELKGHEGPVISICVNDPSSAAAQQRQQRAAAASTALPGREGAGVVAAGGDASGGGPSGEAPIIYSASLDNTIRAYDPYDMTTLTIMREEQSEISCMHVSALSEFVITGNDDGTIRLWNPDSSSTVTLKGHTNTVTCLDVAVRGSTELLLSAGFDSHVGVWDITKRKTSMPRLEAMLKAHRAEVLCLKANPHGREPTFITAGNDKSIHVWALSNYAQLAQLKGHAEAVTCLALDGNFLLSGAEDGVVRVWDMHSYMALAALQIHAAPVEGMLIVPENGLLVTCSTDSTVRVWDYGRGEQLQVWRHPEEFRCVALRRTTGHVLAGTEQCNIVAFPMAEVTNAKLALEQREAASRAGAVETGD